VIDKSRSFRDVPNEYVQLEKPVRARFVRYNHIHAPTPYFALSDLRIFGLGEGPKPQKVENFVVNRQDDRRDAKLSWNKVPGATGYNIRWGIAPDKLYNSWLVYDENQLLMRSLTRNQSYFFTIEAFNENGISERSEYIRIE